MRHRSLLSAACAAVALMGAAPALAQRPPAPVPAAPATPDAFTYQDMISANRLGDPQVSPDGRPTVLLADHPVTGGYPVIAVVADADLDRFAQLRPGDAVLFRHA